MNKSLSNSDSRKNALDLPVFSAATLAAATFKSGFVRRGRPVVIDFSLTAPTALDLDELVASLGAQERQVRIYGEHRMTRPREEWETFCDYEMMEPTAYAAWLTSGEARRRHAYLAQVDVAGTAFGNRVAEWIGATCECLLPVPISGPHLWLGPGGHREPLHFDPADGLLLQISGKKSVILVPPSHSRALYPFPLRSRVRPWFSRVCLAEPDLAKYPRLREALAASIEVLLGPGQALYIPAGWWHEVSSVGDSYTCSVNRFFRVRPLTRLFSVYFGVALYAALVNRRRVLAVEQLVRGAAGRWGRP